MKDIKSNYVINGVVWTPEQLKRLEYERNLHTLHQMKRHDIDITDGEKLLSDDDIDCLSYADAWRVSIQLRDKCSGQYIMEKYKKSFEKSDALWKELGFSLEKPMKVSRCDMHLEGITVQEYMNVMKKMKEDEVVSLSAHPEHFRTIIEEDQLIGIEPFGMFGTPTLVKVNFCKADQLGEQIKKDIDSSYPISMAGKSYLLDDKTAVNVPLHQFKPTENGFDAKLAVYWSENTPEEIVSGHALHLAMEFYRGIMLACE